MNIPSVSLAILVAFSCFFHINADCTPQDCNGKGVCDKSTNICKCNDPWKGNGCEMRDFCKIVSPDDGAYIDRNCNKGRCIPKADADSKSICQCDEGYFGEDCSIPDPCKFDQKGVAWPEGDACLMGGVCTSNLYEKPPSFSCSCTNGRLPPRCKYEDPCLPKDDTGPVCNTNGECQAVYVGDDPPTTKCICQSGYSGPTCLVRNPCVFGHKCTRDSACSRFNNTAYSCICQKPEHTGEFCQETNLCKLPDKKLENGEPCPPLHPECTPCKHGGTCVRDKNGDYGCFCTGKKASGYFGFFCEFKKAKALIIPEGRDLSNYNETFKVVAGREYVFYIVVITRPSWDKTTHNQTTYYQLAPGNKQINISFFNTSFRDVIELKDTEKGILELANRLKTTKLPALYMPFKWTYEPGTFTMQLRLRQNLRYTTVYWNHSLEIQSTLPPGLDCLPTSKLFDVSHTTTDAIEYKRSDHFKIKVALNYECAEKSSSTEWLEDEINSEIEDPRAKYSFEWKMYKLTQNWPSRMSENDWHLGDELLTDAMEKYADFKSHILTEGVYWIECKALVHLNKTDYGSSDLGFFQVVLDPPRIVLDGGTERTVDGNQDIILDAHKSEDVSYPEDNEYLQYIWTCLDPCTKGQWEGPIVKIPPNTFDHGSVIDIFLQVISRHAQNRASEEIKLHIENAFLSVGCKRNCENLNPGDEVAFECNYTLNGVTGPASHLSWSWFPPDETFLDPVKDEPYMTAIDLPRVYDVAPRQVICTATPPGASAIVAKLDVHVNLPPVPGNCTVNPPVGSYMKTRFDIECTPFQDNDQPVTHSFYVDLNKDGGELVANLQGKLLFGFDTNPEISGVYLPYGNPAEDYVLNITVEATDDKGLSSEMNIPVTVLRPEQSAVKQLFEDLIYKNDSIIRKEFHSGDIQAALQLQMIAMYGAYDEHINSALTKEDVQTLLSIVAIELKSSDKGTFKEMEQVINSLHLLKHIEDRPDLEVFKNVGELVIDSAAKLMKLVDDPDENTPKTDVDTLINATADSASSILDAANAFAKEYLKKQPIYPPTANIRNILDFDTNDTSGRDYFSGELNKDNDYEEEGYDEVAESAQPEVKDLGKLDHHAVNALEHTGDAGVKGLGYREAYDKTTPEISIHVEVLPDNTSDINITISTSSPDTQAQLNISKEIMDVIKEGSDGDLVLGVIVTKENPYIDDSSAIPETPILVTEVKAVDTNDTVPVQNTSVPIEITLPFTQQMSQAEIDAGKMHNPIQITPPEDLNDFAEIPAYKMDLPYNSKIAIRIIDVSSMTMTFKVLPMRDRQPILSDFCRPDAPILLLNDSSYTAEFESEKISLSENPQEPFLEYYVGVLAFDLSNPYTFQNFSVLFTRPSCIFRDQDRKFWSEEGCVVDNVVSSKDSLGNTKLEKITCLCNHLSTFAGVQFMIPHYIENTSVFEDFTLEALQKNPIVVITVCTLWALFIIAFIICRYLDKRDERKHIGLTIMADLKESTLDRYYLITVLTGANLWAGTSSCVSLVMYGSNGRSQVYTLKDKNLTVFRRGAVESFLVPCDKILGTLEKIRLWTDHSGHDPAWYCRKILIRHIASEQHWYFYVNRWLTVSAEESTVILEIPATTTEEQKKFYVRFKENILEQIDNVMLWVNVFRYSPASTFTRCQRLSCAFAVLASYLMLDIMAVGIVTEDENGLYEFGDYTIDIYHIMKSILLVIYALPFGTVITALFRNIQPPVPTLIIWKNVVPARTELGDKKLFIPNVHGSIDPDFANMSRKRSALPKEDDDADEDEVDYYRHDRGPIASPDDQLSKSSSTFSIPSTDIPKLEGWIDDRMQNHDSGLQSDENTDIDEEDIFINNLDMKLEENREAVNLARLGRRAMTHAVRHYDPESFIFKGEYGIPSVEELIDKRILEGWRKDEGQSDNEPIQLPLKEKSSRTIKEKISSVLKGIGRKKKAPKELVTDQYLGEIDETLDKEIENREFAQNKENWQSQLALELCLLPRMPKPRCSWPWWVIFIAWFVCIASMIGTTAFTVIFGVHYGYLRSMLWLENLIGSFLMSKFVVQPLNTCAAAFLMTLFGMRHKLQENLQVVIEDSQNSSFLKARKPYTFSIFNSNRTYGPLPGNEIFRLSIKARRRKEVRGKLIRLVVCLIFLIPSIALSYSGHIGYNFLVTRNIRSMFQLNGLGEGKAHFENEEMVYDYLENVVIANIHPDKRYNGDMIRPTETPFLADMQTVLIGVARFRQQRVKPSECDLSEDINAKLNIKCVRIKYFRKSNQDTQDYNPHWKSLENSRRSVPSNNDGWVFNGENSTKTRSLTYSGYQGQYDGGGYILEMGRTRRDSRKVVKYMKKTKWLDQRTRGVFVELTLLNPNINKFISVVMLIEQGPTWSFSLKSWINPLELIPIEEFSEKSDEVAWLSLSLILILIAVICFIYLFIADLLLKRKQHRIFRSFTLWFDFTIIVFAITSVCLYCERFYAAKDVTETIDSQKPDEYVSLQKAAYWDDVQRAVFSITQALVYIKTWKLLMFTDKRFLSFALTLKLTAPYMCAFILILLIQICAFAYSGYFLFGSEILEFSTWGESMITLVDQLLSVSFMEEFQETQPVLGRIYSFSFGFFIVFIGFNFVVALLDLGVHEAKEVVHQRRVWLTFAQYFQGILYRTFPTLNADYRKRKKLPQYTKTLPPERLNAMKQVSINYIRSFLEKTGHFKMLEMKEHCNKMLSGTGYKITSKKAKAEKKAKETQKHVEQLREITTDYLKERLGHEMKAKEYKEYANFNKAIVKLRIDKMEKTLVKLEVKVDEFVVKIKMM